MLSHTARDNILVDFVNLVEHGFPEGECICKSKEAYEKIHILVDPTPDDFIYGMEYCIVISTLNYVNDRVPRIRLLIDPV